MRIHRKSNEARNNNGGNNNNNSQKQSFQVDWFFVVVVLRYWNCFFPNKYICAPSFSCVARAWEWLKNRNKRRKKRSPDFVDNRLLWKRHAQNLFFSLLSVASVFHALNNDPVRRLSAYCNGLPSGYCCSFGWEVVDGLYFFFILATFTSVTNNEWRSESWKTTFIPSVTIWFCSVSSEFA